MAVHGEERTHLHSPLNGQFLTLKITSHGPSVEVGRLE